MIEVRKRDTLYHKEGGWFAANWHFSFDEYHDPKHMGFGSLRVFNDDTLRPGAVWPMHPHRNIEGITYVVEGMFEHRDSLGNGGVLPPGSVQRVTLGSGMMHAEANHSKIEPMRFIQMWVLPGQRDLEPSIEQQVFTRQQRTNRLLPVVTPQGNGTVQVHQNASIFVSALAVESMVGHDFLPGMGAYLFLIDGEITVNGVTLSTGDAAFIRREERLVIRASTPSELIMVEVELERVPVPQPSPTGAEEEDEDEEQD